MVSHLGRRLLAAAGLGLPLAAFAAPARAPAPPTPGLAVAAKPLATGLGPLSPPVAGARLQAGFGWVQRAGRPVFQPYAVLAAEAGSALRAVAAGTVAGIHDDPAQYGLYVLVDHAGPWGSLYGDCGTVLVHPGEVVHGGTALCTVGSAGLAAFALRYDDQAVDPGPYLGLDPGN